MNPPCVQSIKVLIVDDQEQARAGIRWQLGLHPDRIIFHFDEAASGAIAVQKVKKISYQLIIIDYQMDPMNGIETTKNIRRYNLKTKIIGISFFTESGIINAMMDAGANGFVQKDIDHEEFIKGVELVLKGKIFFSNTAANELIFSNPRDSKKIRPHLNLSKREKEVLFLIAQQFSTPEIAIKLGIKPRTVETHRYKLSKKLGVNNIAGLMRWAQELKLKDDNKKQFRSGNK